ncbi:hypothetical protein FDECE_10420 [Fusarium decemcellulare]|nr:hypothetical protein FDECE_10420 [Fusarium decemcellulare]
MTGQSKIDSDHSGEKEPETKTKDSITTTSVEQVPEPFSPVVYERWRPGRSAANREINLGLRRSQRLQEKQEDVPTAQKDKHSEDREPTPSVTKRARRPIPPDWVPPLAVGASLGDNLSRLEEAERSVLQWEAILENARKKEPSADFSGFERRLDKVRREFQEMEESEENSIPVDDLESTKRDRIEKRLVTLSDALERSQCSAGDVNIKAAIEAYKDGRIQCWNKWTLLYAGHIVDFCTSYDSFTHDREERLNRYWEEHGEGWLWYESPLAPKGGYQPEQLMGATWGQPARGSTLSGGQPQVWDITMGFRRVRGFHHRSTSTLFSAKAKAPDVSASGKVLPYKTLLRHLPHSTRKEVCYVEDDPNGPRCFFMMQLDTGASSPCLYGTDLDLIGINPKVYPAQTFVSVSTANQEAHAAVYEIRVDVCKHNGESLVGEEPVWPKERAELGGIVPVLVMVESAPDESQPLSAAELKYRRRRGEDVSEEALASRKKSSREVRLSGILPFQVCYSACTPGMNVWFGEDRRDVLGADRMPGQRRWERHKMANVVKGPAQIEALTERPRVRFDHESDGLRVVDSDDRDVPGASSVTIMDGVEIREFGVEPRVSKELQVLKHERLRPKKRHRSRSKTVTKSTKRNRV